MTPRPAIIDISPIKETSGPFWDDLRLFWADRHTYRYEPAPMVGDPDLDWITSESGVPWLELDIDIPRHEQMFEEALACRDLFVGHGGGIAGGGKAPPCTVSIQEHPFTRQLRLYF